MISTQINMPQKVSIIFLKTVIYLGRLASHNWIRIYSRLVSLGQMIHCHQMIRGVNKRMQVQKLNWQLQKLALNASCCSPYGLGHERGKVYHTKAVCGGLG